MASLFLVVESFFIFFRRNWPPLEDGRRMKKDRQPYMFGRTIAPLLGPFLKTGQNQAHAKQLLADHLKSLPSPHARQHGQSSIRARASHAPERGTSTTGVIASARCGEIDVQKSLRCLNSFQARCQLIVPRGLSASAISQRNLRAVVFVGAAVVLCRA